MQSLPVMIDTYNTFIVKSVTGISEVGILPKLSVKSGDMEL